MGKEKAGYIYSDQLTFFGEREILGFGTSQFYVKEVKRDFANQVIKNNHYSGKYYNLSYIHLGVYLKGCFVGVLQYGYAMNPASAGGIVPKTKNNEYLELNRMWIDDKAGRNSESQAISQSIKFIKKKYPQVKFIQSFADERCKLLGIVYQACSSNISASIILFFGSLKAKFSIIQL